MVQIHHKNPVSSLYAGVGELAQPHGLGPWFWRFESSRPYHMPLQLSWQSRCFVNIRSGVQVPLAAVIMKKPSRGDDVFTNSSNMNKKADYFLVVCFFFWTKLIYNILNFFTFIRQVERRKLYDQSIRTKWTYNIWTTRICM